MTSFRNQGLGASLVQCVQSEARQHGQAVRLHVAADSPARSLYARLGFQLIEDRGSHWFMEWRAAAADERNATNHAG